MLRSLGCMRPSWGRKASGKPFQHWSSQHTGAQTCAHRLTNLRQLGIVARFLSQHWMLTALLPPSLIVEAAPGGHQGAQSKSLPSSSGCRAYISAHVCSAYHCTAHVCSARSLHPDYPKHQLRLGLYRLAQASFSILVKLAQVIPVSKSQLRNASSADKQTSS